MSIRQPRSAAGATRLAAALLLLLLLVTAAPGHAAGNTPVFVLHSYSQEYPWTKRQHDGFMRKLGALAPDAIAASVEYLDTKRVPYTEAYADLVAAHLAQKYAGFEPKLVYVTDDNALLFALTHLTRIFPRAPIFFSGINDYDMKQRIDPGRITGVFEKKEIAPNLELMGHLSPGVRDILVVGDESETFRAIRREIVDELAHQPNIRAQFLSSGRIERLAAALQGRKEQFVFLTTLGAMTDAAGNTLTLPETIAAIVRSGRFIIISMEDVYLYPGVLGGYVTSGYKQGAAAAELAARYLSGTAVAAIKPIESSPNEYIIDGAELERLGLTLPPGLEGRTTIVDPPPTFIERNLALIVRSLYALALLFVVSLVAFIYALMRKNRQIARTSAELAAQTGRLRTVVEGFPVVLWAVDREGIFTLSRGAGLKALGLGPDEVVGKSVYEIYRDVPAIIEDVRRALAGDSHMATNRVGALAFETHYAPLRDAAGVVVGATGVSTDVTQRKKAEEALRASEEKFAKAFRSSPMFVAISTAADGRYFDVNDAALNTMGYTREEIIGHTASEIRLWKSPEDRQRAVDILRKHGRISGFEAELRKKSGEWMVGEIWGEPIVVDSQQCIFWVTNDITARKQAEAEILRINTELEQRVAERTQALEAANAELEAFSYSVSHDLRAPLRAIHGFSSLVEKQYAGQIDEQGRDMLRRVGAGAQRMGLLIDDLLRLSRISRQAMRIEPVDLSTLAWEVAGELQADEPERKIEWVIAPQVTARGDSGLLRVALQNLIGNAWKFTSRRDAARIEFGMTEKDGRTVYFVGDNGAGFDMAYVAQLFGAFHRLHSAAEFSGTGIGLATVSRVIRRHGGEVWAEGRVNEGARFYFTL